MKGSNPRDAKSGHIWSICLMMSASTSSLLRLPCVLPESSFMRWIIALIEVVGFGLLTFTPQPGKAQVSGCTEQPTPPAERTSDEREDAIRIARVDQDAANLAVAVAAAVRLAEIGVDVVRPFETDPELLETWDRFDGLDDCEADQVLHKDDPAGELLRKSEDERELQASRRRNPRVAATPSASDLMRRDAYEPIW